MTMRRCPKCNGRGRVLDIPDAMPRLCDAFLPDGPPAPSVVCPECLGHGWVAAPVSPDGDPE